MDVSRYNEDVQKKIANLESYKNESYGATMRLAEELITIANRRNDTGLRGLCYYYLGRYYSNLRKGSDAVRYLRKAIKDCDEGKNMDEYCRAMSLLGMTFVRQGNYPSAMQVYTSLLSTTEKVEQPKIQIRSYMDVAEICYNIKNFEQALRFELAADRIFYKIMRMDIFPSYYARHLEILLRTHVKLGDSTNANDILGQLDKFAQDNSGQNLEPFVSIAHIIWANFTSNHKWDDVYYNRLIEFFRGQTFTGYYQFEFVYTFEALSKEDKFENAFRVLLSKLDHYLEYTDLYGMRLSACEIKLEYFERKGDQDKSLEQLKEYREDAGDMISLQNETMGSLMESSILNFMQDNVKEMVERHSDSDELTDLPNRKAYNNMADQFFETCRGGRKDLGVVMITIDNVKKINDVYGYTIGDSCLMAVADVLRKYKSDSIYVARYVGAEFVMLFAGYSDQAIMDTLRTINDEVFMLISQRDLPEFTLAEGICVHVPELLNKIWDFTSVADLALIRAQRLGTGQALLVRHTTELQKAAPVTLSQGGRLFTIQK